MKFCSKCGSQMEDNAVFCLNCGASVVNAPAPAAAPQAQAPVAPQAQAPVAPQVQAPVAPQVQAPVAQQPVYAAPYGASQMPYGAPQMPYAAPKVPGKGLGIASMVLGIICLALFCIPYVAIPCAIISCILGGVGLAKSKKVGAKNGVAVAGLVCSIIALAVAVVILATGAEILEEIF